MASAIARRSAGSSGVTSLGKNARMRPSLPMTYLLKFHAGSGRLRRGRCTRRLTAAGLGHDLREHRKRHVVSALAEGRDLLAGARLLIAEVVAREAEHGKALVLELAMQRLEPFVLRRVSAVTGHVDDQRHLAAIVAKVSRLAKQRLRFQIVKRRRAGRRRAAAATVNEIMANMDMRIMQYIIAVYAFIRSSFLEAYNPTQEIGLMTRLCFALAAVFALSASVGIAQQTGVGYHVTKTYELGGEGAWDYIVPCTTSIAYTSDAPTG